MKLDRITLSIGLVGAALLVLQGCTSSSDTPATAPVVAGGGAGDASSLPTLPAGSGNGSGLDGGGTTDPVLGLPPESTTTTDPTTGLPTGPMTVPPDDGGTDPTTIDPSTGLPLAPTGPTITPVPPTGTGDFSAIAGLYDDSESVDGVVDVLYIEIATDGTFTAYDYFGDDFDQGPNCYDIDILRLESIGGDSYRFVTTEGDDSPFTLARSGDSLIVGYVDEDDDDEDGDTTETLTETLPAITGISSIDFNACEL